MRRWLILWACLGVAAVLSGQERAAVCSSPEHHQFDFWIGDWNLESWQRMGPGEEDFAQGTATSKVRLILRGCVVEETFEGVGLPSPVEGRSLSAYDPVTGEWKQTWVDSEGAFLTLRGKWEEGRMVLARKESEQVETRVTWSETTGSSYSWVYERTTDGGRTWLLVWRVSATRRPATDGVAE